MDSLQKPSSLPDVVDPIVQEFVASAEHLAFVRGGGVEIGHLAAPPRNRSTISGTVENLHRARAGIGCRPLIENVATLIDPPGSDLNEQQWTADILGAGEADLLLDLHNLHANATNFGFDAQDFIRSLPPESIAALHLAGGRWIRGSGRPRLLDDHFHDIPDPVYELLVEVGRHVRLPLTVILERDGDYPPIDRLLQQLDAARATLRKGRAAQAIEKEAADVARVLRAFWQESIPIPNCGGAFSRIRKATPFAQG